MSNSSTIIGTSNTPAEPTSEAAVLASLIKGVGPKEVRTPNMTVVAHDIAAVQRVMERRNNTVIPSLCNLSGCRTVPNRQRYDMLHNLHENEADNGSCGCG